MPKEFSRGQRVAEQIRRELAELAVVIGKVTRNVSPEQALGKVFGYTVANDVTARDVQRAEDQWARANPATGTMPACASARHDRRAIRSPSDEALRAPTTATVGRCSASRLPLTQITGGASAMSRSSAG